jgi:hypothetical protein
VVTATPRKSRRIASVGGWTGGRAWGCGTSFRQETIVTIQQLYALYERVYADSSPFHVDGEPGATRHPAHRSGTPGTIEKAIAALAVHDATNGTTRRSPRAFLRAVEDGSRLLGGFRERASLALEPGP